MTNQNSFLSKILTIILSIIYFVTIYYLDFYVISPLILPADYCYYHTHETPFWVELLYMNAGSNGHPDGSMLHFVLLIIISLFLGKITGKIIIKICKNATY